MINIGTPDVLWLDDEWTVITADMSLSAHYENTIIITEGRTGDPDADRLRDCSSYMGITTGKREDYEH